MIKVVTSEEMRHMDQFTIEEIGIPGVVLMENAGANTSSFILQVLKEMDDPLISVFCGKGNNGGDGFVIARYLWDAGYLVEIFCIARENEIQGDARVNFEIAQKLDIPIYFLQNQEDLDEIITEVPDLIVDALLGTGIKGPVKGFVKEVIDFINEMETMVVSVDVPSGLNGSSPEVAGSVILADFTVTMGLPKICHALYPAKKFVGELLIAEIGIPTDIRVSDEIKTQVMEKSDIIFPFRDPETHKYRCGKIAVVAGSPGLTGAAALTSEAALKIGAGLVTLGIPESLNPIMEQKLTEVITRPLPETPQKTIGLNSMDGIRELLEWCDVLAIGPGLGRTPEVQETVIQILNEFQKPVVIDADALFALANHLEIFETPHPNWILTPHLGEFARLQPEINKADLENNRIEIAREFAEKNQLILVLKGAPTLTAVPDGNVYINGTGNSGLASGGTGDVLTGFISGLLAQGRNDVWGTARATYMGNLIHGYVADYIVEKGSPYTLVAGDLITQLAPALHDLIND